ncbi:unnamed protein product [Soboliphyme baturini]|uniref:Transposase n=1 Tax=Soboliphyme baturini TaxID=241478 RepID=A0A183J7Z6_9BILA|nr:unnamed protein product [Soboliphyme baturini]
MLDARLPTDQRVHKRGAWIDDVEANENSRRRYEVWPSNPTLNCSQHDRPNEQVTNGELKNKAINTGVTKTLRRRPALDGKTPSAN